jgi:hypothetical protein
MEIWDISRILKTVVRLASPPVDACEGSSHTLFVRCIIVIFLRPMGHFVRNNYSVLLNMAPVYHIVAIRVNKTSWVHVWRLHFHYLRTGYDSVI